MEGVNQEYLEELKQKSRKKLNEIDLYQFKGSVSKLLGLTVEVKLPGLKIGDLCYIEAATGEKKPAEVVAFKTRLLFLSRYAFTSLVLSFIRAITVSTVSV